MTLDCIPHNSDVQLHGIKPSFCNKDFFQAWTPLLAKYFKVLYRSIRQTHFSSKH